MSALGPAGSTRRWREIRAWVLERDGWTCRADRDGRMCGAHATTVGHIVRREFGGGDGTDNLRAECGPCNFGDRPPALAAVKPVRPSTWQTAIAAALDAAGLAVGAGRGQALSALTRIWPGVRLRLRDVDRACRWRRQRGPLIRM